MERVIESGGLRLAAHLALPPEEEAGPGPRPGLVLCHGFPAAPEGAAASGATYPELADRLAADSGWAVLTFNFRGTGRSEGDFSLAGWLDDLRAAVDHLLGSGQASAVWTAGSSTGGALAICEAAEDDRVRGVAALAAPPHFEPWAADPQAFLAHARELGAIRDPAFPPDLTAWARSLAEIRPVSAIGKLPPRPVLLVHGSDDDVVPVEAARVLAEASSGQVEVHVLTGAGHRVRHDPRAVAVLLGWLERQAGAAGAGRLGDQ